MTPLASKSVLLSRSSARKQLSTFIDFATFPMNIENISGTQNFNLTDLSFAELKTVRDACMAHAKGGSSAAAEIARQIQAAIENIAI